ncbi:hypothetical protein VPHD479_0284 [Vibrio phage D479]
MAKIDWNQLSSALNSALTKIGEETAKETKEFLEMATPAQRKTLERAMGMGWFINHINADNTYTLVLNGKTMNVCPKGTYTRR